MCVFECVSQRERENVCVCLSVCHRERGVYVCVFECVSQRERCVCVCV